MLKLIDRKFSNDGWIDGNDVSLSDIEDIRASVDGIKPIDFERFGLTWGAKTVNDDPIVVVVATGGDEYSSNSFKIDFSPSHGKPPLELFLEVIELVDPIEAFYFFDTVERLLRQNVYEFGTNRFKIKSLRCVEYLDSATISRNWGQQVFTEIPNSRKTLLPNGILLEFDGNCTGFAETNVVRNQLEAMKWLGMIHDYRLEKVAER